MADEIKDHGILPECELQFQQIRNGQESMLTILNRIDVTIRGNGKPGMVVTLALQEERMAKLQTRLDRAQAYLWGLAIPLVLLTLGTMGRLIWYALKG